MDPKEEKELSIIPGSGVDEGAEPSKDALEGKPVRNGQTLSTEDTPRSLLAGVGKMDEKGRLQLKARQLNILVDDKWDINRLRGEIQMAREGRADLQVKGAVPSGDMSDLDSDPATKADKKGIQTTGVIPKLDDDETAPAGSAAKPVTAAAPGKAK